MDPPVSKAIALLKFYVKMNVLTEHVRSTRMLIVGSILSGDRSAQPLDHGASPNMRLPGP